MGKIFAALAVCAALAAGALVAPEHAQAAAPSRAYYSVAADQAATDAAAATGIYATNSVTPGYHDFRGIFEWKLGFTFPGYWAEYIHYSWSRTNYINVLLKKKTIQDVGWSVALGCGLLPMGYNAFCAAIAKVFHDALTSNVRSAIKHKRCLAMRVTGSIINDKIYTVRCYK